MKSLLLCTPRGASIWKNGLATVVAIAADQRAQDLKELDLDRDKFPMEQALGLHWCVETDSFQVQNGDETTTPYQTAMLSLTSLTLPDTYQYDPLGFLVPVTLLAKMMQQELCRGRYGWDDDLPLDILHQWKE